jgi:hypothetical protein
MRYSSRFRITAKYLHTATTKYAKSILAAKERRERKRVTVSRFSRKVRNGREGFLMVPVSQIFRRVQQRHLTPFDTLLRSGVRSYGGQALGLEGWEIEVGRWKMAAARWPICADKKMRNAGTQERAVRNTDLMGKSQFYQDPSLENNHWMRRLCGASHW